MIFDVIAFIAALVLIGSLIRIATLNTKWSNPIDHDHL